MNSRPHIVCGAEPFCYGPASTLSAILTHLTPFADTTILATGTALELLRHETRASILACNTKIAAEIWLHKGLIARSSLALSVLDGDGSLLRVARSLGVPTAYIDVLFWVWPGAAEADLRDADYYFIEDHFEARSRLYSREFKIRNPILVPPIIENTVSVGHERRGSQLLITFGGIDSPLTKSGINTNYHLIIAKILLQDLENVLPFDRILFTGGETAMKQLVAQFDDRGGSVRFASLGHVEYLEELSRSSLLLAHPGLSTPMEAFAYNIPIVFLPPMNYTQVMQLRRFRALGCAPYGIEWEELLYMERIPEDLPEPDGVMIVLQYIKRLETDNTVYQSLRERLGVLVQLSDTEKSQLGAAQSTFKQHWSENGAQLVAQTLRRGLNA